MLLHLTINNFAIIKSTNIDLQNGITVLTGETGAGKSILLDALSFVLGARLEKSFLNKDSSTEVSAVFCIKDNKKVQDLLDEMFIEYESECTIRRVVNKNAQSRIFINGSVSKSSDVKKVSDTLINIYSQNSHQSLLDAKSQLSLLDSFANNDDLLDKVSRTFKELQKIEKEISEYREKSQENQSQIELLEYKLNELSELNLYENEFEDISNKQKELSSVDDRLRSLSLLSNGLYDDENSLMSQISILENEVNNNLDDIHFKSLAELIAQAKLYINESYDETKSLLETIEQNPEELAKINQRMSEIYDFARKHKVEPTYLYKHIDNLEKELESLSCDTDKLEDLIKHKDKLEQEYSKQAQELSKKRTKSAVELSKQVEKNIRQLNIPKGSFAVELNKLEHRSIKGDDSCKFLMNFNTSDELSEVKKVASGGELSRIGLALQAVSAAKKSYPTLVFDEVDVGISGATAEVVGNLLKDLSNRLQVICITHQAQVAAKGDIHLHVEKKYLKDDTVSKIIELDQQQRIQEIAKMVGGLEISENTLKHAKELLKI